MIHVFLGDRKMDPRENWRPYLRQLAMDQRAGLTNALFVRQVPSRSAIPTVALIADGEQLQNMNADILRYGLGDVERRAGANGLLAGPGDQIFTMKMRLRGTNMWDHQQWKPSLQVRLAGRKLLDGYRDHLLVAPEDATGLRNWLSVELANRMGLPNTEEAPVRVFLNGAYKGLYTRQRRLDESLLIHQGRPPGPFVRLESMMGRAFVRKEAMIYSPQDWEVQGTSDPEAARESLRPLLELFNEPPSPQRFGA